MTLFIKKILTGLFLFSAILLNGQSKMEVLKDFNFVNYNENYIHFYTQQAHFNTFFSKLDSLLKFKKGKVRIMQMGGSHIQAEIWPDQVRKDFLSLSDDINGGRGFFIYFMKNLRRFL